MSELPIVKIGKLASETEAQYLAYLCAMETQRDADQDIYQQALAKIAELEKDKEFAIKTMADLTETWHHKNKELIAERNTAIKAVEEVFAKLDIWYELGLLNTEYYSSFKAKYLKPAQKGD